MEPRNCPTCGEPVSTWVNPRKQRVGKCRTCRKLVNFGNEKSSKEADAQASNAPERTAQEPDGGKPAAGTTRTGKRAARAGATTARGRRPVRPREPIQQPEPRKRTYAERIIEWFEGKRES